MSGMAREGYPAPSRSEHAKVWDEVHAFTDGNGGR